MPRASALRLDLAAQIAELIRVEEQPAHTPLREEGLAARLGVSRTPIRGALKILQRSGHVYYKENAGVFVAPGAKGRGQFKVPAEARPAEALYRKILADRGRRALGDTVSEAELLARYRVPRSLLSRVLIRIHGEGFIERRRGHGWEFQPLLDTPQAIAESFRFRAIVESAGLLEAGFKLDGAEVKRVRERHRRFIAAKATARTAREFFDMNSRFHEMLAQGSGNRFLLQSIEQIDRLRKFQEFASFTADSGALVSSCREHLAILDAIEVGDREWAAALMRRHLQEGAERVLSSGLEAGTVFDSPKVQGQERHG
jgi:DNA-binding GntR family transcriptional regulator